MTESDRAPTTSVLAPRRGHGRAADERSGGSGRRRRVVALAGLGLVLLAGLAATWLTVRLGQTRDSAEAARAAGTRARAAVTNGDPTRARAELTAARSQSERALSKVSDPVYALAAKLPLVGDDLAAVRTVVRALDDVTGDVLAPAVDVGTALDPATLRLRGGRLDLAPLMAARADVLGAAEAAERARDEVAGIDGDGLLGPVSRAVTDARTALDELVHVADQARTATQVLPPMLGAEGRRRYLLAFQNSAEARGTGGLLGAYGVLEADAGRLRLVRLGANTDLRSAPDLPVELGEDFRELYNDDPALWVNGNMSPHFPYAAQIWLALWQRQTGEQLDGVVATDPTALSYLLAATGPVRLPGGERVTSATAVPLTMRDVYARYPRATGADNSRRDAYLRQIAGAVFRTALSGVGEPRAVGKALGRAAGERRLLVYSTRPAEQDELAGTTMAGVLDDRPGPYAALAVNNAAGGKLDYYLRRTLRYRTIACEPSQRRTRITVDLTNSAPTRGLPEYVALRVDRGGDTGDAAEPAGTNALLVQVYGARDAELTEARLDGKPVLIGVGAERGHSVFQLRLTIGPGRTRRLELDLVEPPAAEGGGVGGFRQPLVLPEARQIEPTSCPAPSQ